MEPATLSEAVSKLHTAPETFASFYRRLVDLQFPLDVAEVLELRYQFNHAIDHAPEQVASADFNHFRATHLKEVESLGLDSHRHSDRLVRLLAWVRELHLQHSIDSRNQENYLRRALANNAKARERSRRYAKIAGLATLALAAVWWAIPQPAWWAHLTVLAGVYFSGDYFYSLSILKREQVLLAKRLEEVLARRVRALDWRRLTRNVAIVLGYARPRGVQAFTIQGELEDAHLAL